MAYLMPGGRVEQIIADLKQALDIDPNSMLTNRLSGTRPEGRATRPHLKQFGF
jgi:hypothetical protein